MVRFGLLLTILLGTVLPSNSFFYRAIQLNDTKCGYQGCNLGKEDFLNIHLIPHTHDDVGWLKTVDQYYYGSKSFIAKAGVQYILDSVIQALMANPERRFTYVEMAFFIRWWRQQTLEVREQVRKLVKSGQLQFALGAWAMADEATVHYSDAIDQMTRGHDLLKRLFGECGIPLVSWQIDPFGHARDHADIFSEAGFDAVYFQRMDYREKEYRRSLRSLEVLWDTGLELSHNATGLFTGMFYDSYCYPANFCFDDKCHDDPIRDDPDMEDYNVPERVEEFMQYIGRIRKAFQTNHIMVLMGCDFTYENANMNFKNMDKLIKHANRLQASGSKINLLYSTPQCYTKAVNQAFQKRGDIDRRGGDFFPYASGPDSYWTGYFTSRPALKRFVRKASNLLTMCEQMHLFANRLGRNSPGDDSDGAEESVDRLRQALGVMQHHDAVTGTEKQHVADDYAKILSKGCASCENVIASAMLRLMPELRHVSGSHPPQYCDLLNISLCSATDGWKPYLNQTGHGGVYLFIYNPTGWNIWNPWIRIPLYIEKMEKDKVRIILRDVRLPDKEINFYQLVPITDRTISIPERHSQEVLANMELVFNAAAVGLPTEPTGFTTFYLALENRTSSVTSYHEQVTEEPDPCASITKVSQTTKLYMEIDNSNHPLTIVAEHLATGMRTNLTLDLFYYFGEMGYSQPSGAYVFLPKQGYGRQEFQPPSVHHIRGGCVEEVHLKYETWATVVVRLYCNGHLEVEWTVGPIPDDYYQNSREVVIRYTLSGQGLEPEVKGEFYTDSAGRRLIRRVRNQRLDWNLPFRFNETQPIAGNYYPIVNRIMLKGKNTNNAAMAFAVYTDRSEGGSSINDGQLEIMLHRRLVRDDGYGVGEPLFEQGIDNRGLIVRGRHILRLDERVIIDLEDPITASHLDRSPITLFTPSISPPRSRNTAAWNGLNIALPPYIHLLSLVAWPLIKSSARPDDPEQVLIRLEHLGSDLLGISGDHQLDVTSLLRGVKITKATEVTLTANQEKSVAQSRRLKWPTEDVPPGDRIRSGHTADNKVIVTIPHGQIATFILDYKRN
ncbi:unnamed protein product [Calicophoron daubneyi]|uniref:Alpha-mannosidase n=1 Tax=Calicophoron daubneyi TaxID=300641 RepID=A0AAV2T5Y1_CALDB